MYHRLYYIVSIPLSVLCHSNLVYGDLFIEIEDLIRCPLKKSETEVHGEYSRKIIAYPIVHK